MHRLNALLYPNIKKTILDESFSPNPLNDIDFFEDMLEEFLEEFGYKNINSFSFTKEGFLALMLMLDGSIAVSLGECRAIVDGALLYEKLGNRVVWIDILKDGQLDYDSCTDLKTDYFFVSSYIIDTFVRVSLGEIKELTEAKIIANCSANRDIENTDIILFDGYKLSGYGVCGVVLYSNAELEEQYLGERDAMGIKLIYEGLREQTFDPSSKNDFIANLKLEFKEDLYFFIEPNSTLDFVLHFGLRDIMARDIILALNLNNILLTNGEGCSLGLSEPSQTIRNMGYDENSSRWALSLSFTEKYTLEDINKIIKTMSSAYKQIKAFT